MAPLKQELDLARETSDRLFAVVRSPYLYERPVSERHRLVFYLGHLDTFDWNLIGRRTSSQESFHPQFDKLFEAGIDPPVGQGPSDQPGDWPTLEEVAEYNRQCRQRIDELAPQVPEDVIRMAVEHRYMHAETLAYLIHTMPYDRKIPVKLERVSGQDFGPRIDGMVDVSGGLVTLGKGRDEGFGWDNEFEKHFARVPPFRMDRYKVTNGEYLQFVEAGARAPHFWRRRGGEWRVRGMFESVPLPLDWPVYVTYEQASEYAQWRGLCLPTEGQFHRAAFGARSGEEREYAWGDADPGTVAGNFDFRRWDPVSVYAAPESESAFGIAQLVGNGWEWTSTPFAPFAGFEPSPNYPGYSQNFFDGHHFVIKGASPRTAKCFLRRSFRNWFRPDYPYVYATFRCVEC